MQPPMNAAELQVVLEGVALPAHKQALIDYARKQDADAADRLQSLPERQYRSLDEVGEALAPVQPRRAEPHAETPHEESGDPPGDDAYVDPHPDTGAIRPSIPPDNPPQKTLEEQTKTQKRQQERQQQLG
jgi:hypothetical protein